jgi:hypothetical protein
MSSAVVDRLVEASNAGLLLPEAPDYEQAQLAPDDAAAAARWVEEHPDRSAFHVLMTLSRAAPGVYESIAAEVRAAILVATLSEYRQLNDFGYLDPQGSYDGPAALAMVELGDAAVTALRPLLSDYSRAPLSGSEEATMSKIYRYRRADFAYRLLCRVLGRDAPFDADPAERDKHIATLRDELG